MLAALVILFITGDNKSNRRLDQRMTFKRQDKIPYGSYAAYQNLKHIFPQAVIYNNKLEPGYWDSISMHDSHQAIIVISPNFMADKYEMERLIDFAENGNDVFISAFRLSYDVKKILDCAISEYNLPSDQIDYEQPAHTKDSLTVSLYDPPFTGKTGFTYPGRSYSSSFTEVNDETTGLLGEGDSLTNFIRLRAGEGNVYVHLTPTVFSNYFLLHKNNIDYYEKALSVIDPAVTKVVWDEYFLNKKEEYQFNYQPRTKRKGWFITLMNLKNGNEQKPFRPAFWLLISLLLLFVLLGMRRKQRHIPVVAKPRNDSLDFVKTIGRLYYERGDHRNLCRKMTAYFLEHVRNKYKLPTRVLDENFIRQLKFKTGVDETEIRGIVASIDELERSTATVSADSLTRFHRQLESFYKKA